MLLILSIMVRVWVVAIISIILFNEALSSYECGSYGWALFYSILGVLTRISALCLGGTLVLITLLPFTKLTFMLFTLGLFYWYTIFVLFFFARVFIYRAVDRLVILIILACLYSIHYWKSGLYFQTTCILSLTVLILAGLVYISFMYIYFTAVLLSMLIRAQVSALVAAAVISVTVAAVLIIA